MKYGHMITVSYKINH